MKEKDKEDKKCPCNEPRKKKRSPKEQKALLKRLRLAEGQIRGIQAMVENDAWCPEILVQVSAVTAALNSFSKELLACHIKSCVAEDIRAGNDEAIDDFVKMLQKLMK
ncbi:MAG: metal-sensing transcriptional repressor [Clostridia bacterium]|jgi:DNA-binding FrmR family transcriptional regulator|nr:metal-sensing transcriptional repressor [Clostridia bacterium]